VGMIGISIKNFEILLYTVAGDYGFKCEFDSGLNVIRGGNSSGKSTLINALIYSLGMEELIGGKGVKVLPYALKEYVEDIEKNKIKISSSYVMVEIENKLGEIITLKRTIVSENKDSKLVEIIQGAYLSKENSSYRVIPTYLHDKGSAQGNNSGFFSYIEKFMALELPTVAGSNGGEVKLYLQTIFSALLIEQKRGWTDYIANTPYYAIRDVRTKIVEFILNLDIFDNERQRAKILSEITQIKKMWVEKRYELNFSAQRSSVIVSGIRESVVDDFDSQLVELNKISDDKEIQVYLYIGDLIDRIERIENKGTSLNDNSSGDLIHSYNRSKNELDKLISSLDNSNSDIRLAKSRLQEYKNTKTSIEEELKKNKTALKLKKFGAEQSLEIAKDCCPSCHQKIDDSLMLADTLIQPMSLEENIKYLDSQRKMVARYLNGLKRSIQKLDIQSTGLIEEIYDKRMFCLSLKKDLRAFNVISESEVRLKVQLEDKVSGLTNTVDSINESIEKLSIISIQYKKARKALAKIPTKQISNHDSKKLQELQSSFRDLAQIFGYKSAPTTDIEINPTLFPYLSGIELREVNTDIKSDSSASDFVRLIWAYLISIYSVSNKYNGNHLGFIVFDEPAQHSMAVSSINSLFKALSKKDALQSIVGASFDESDRVFRESVDGVKHNLIIVGEKLLKPLS
jgi:hypothetical protein